MGGIGLRPVNFGVPPKFVKTGRLPLDDIKKKSQLLLRFPAGRRKRQARRLFHLQIRYAKSTGSISTVNEISFGDENVSMIFARRELIADICRVFSMIW